MSERQMQFGVGLFTLIALGVGGGLVFHFGKLTTLLDRHYTVAVHFERSPDIQAGVPVRRLGVRIGAVREVVFNEEQDGVTAFVDISERFRLRRDSKVKIATTILGDVSLDVKPGSSREFLNPGELIAGEAPADPMEMVKHMEQQMATTLQSFAATSQEWQKVARNFNSLMQTNEGDLHVVIQRAAVSLDEFAKAMNQANRFLANTNQVFGDPQQQENIRKMVSALPALVDDTRKTVQATQLAMTHINANLENLSNVTKPLAGRSETMLASMENSLKGLEVLLADLNRFSKQLSNEDGSLQQLATNPQMYRNLEQSTATLTLLLKHLEPAARDLRIFSDKIARHPEVLGVSGAMKGSSGLKDAPEETTDGYRGPIRQTGGTR